MLRLTISLPLVGDAVALTKIVRVSLSMEGGKETLSLGTEIVDMDDRSRDLVANYLLQFSNLPNAELNWFDPKGIAGRDPTHTDGVITFQVPEESDGGILGDDDGEVHKGVFSWTFVSGTTFGAVQTIVNPIYIRDQFGNYGHRMRVVTGQNLDDGPGFGPASSTVPSWTECDELGEGVVLPWCSAELPGGITWPGPSDND